MPTLLFTPESARLLAKKSAEVRRARALAAKEANKAIAVASAARQSPGLETASRAAKSQLSDDLLSQLALLRIEPPSRLNQLGNTPDGEGRASLVKRIAETAAMVYGWDNDKGNSLIVVGLIDRLDPDNQVSTVQEPAAIDVEATPANPG